MRKRAISYFRHIVGRLGFILATLFILLAIIVLAIDAGRIDDPY